MGLPGSGQAGLDSLGAVELRNAVSAKFGAELSATAIFDYPTIAALADHLIAISKPPPGTIVASADSSFGAAASGGHISSNPSSRPNVEEIVCKLTALLLETVGASVGADEPFMEVGYLSHACVQCRTGLKTACA